MAQQLLAQFLTDHQLSASYLSWANTHFCALLADIQASCKNKKPVFVMINGSQGSGKSTLAAYLQAALQEKHQLSSLCVSLDDFYHARAKRQTLAKTIHPLLATRGVPGTHDIALAINTMHSLAAGRPTSIVRFDKSIDDRAEEKNWQKISSPQDVIIMEGWCMGASPQAEAELAHAVNELERCEDPTGQWRQFVNQQLASNYQTLFAFADISVMLKAPSFDAVFAWRWQQEEKLAEMLQEKKQSNTETLINTASDELSTTQQRTMSKKEVARFIQHYQRLTEHMLNVMPTNVMHLYALDEQRRIIHEQHKQQPLPAENSS